MIENLIADALRWLTQPFIDLRYHIDYYWIGDDTDEYERFLCDIRREGDRVKATVWVPTPEGLETVKFDLDETPGVTRFEGKPDDIANTFLAFVNVESSQEGADDGN